MAWGPGQSVTTASIATNLQVLFVFGATDSGKNLVTGTTYATSLSGSAAYGSDVIGTYLEVGSTAGRLNHTYDPNIPNPTGDFSWSITFSRTANSLPNWAGVFRIANSGGGTLNAFQREDNTASMRVWSIAGSTAIAYNLAGISADAEWTLVYTRSGTTGKFFYKSGSSPIALTDSSGTFSGATVYGEFGGWTSGEYFPSRQRAFARWTRALSDAEAQSMADNPQQIITPAVTYTYARPTSDITTQWTPSTGTDHYALIDETTANDSDYIYATAAGQTDEVRLASMAAPQAGTSLLINYRVQGIVGSASVTLSLVCNTTVIATDTARTANGNYTLTVPSGTWASVADWTNMRLRFVSA